MVSNKNIEKLRNNSRFLDFVDSVCTIGHGHNLSRMIDLIITGDNQSYISPEDVARYLEDVHSFRTIDFRNKSAGEIYECTYLFRYHPRIRMILPALFNLPLYRMFYWIYESNEIKNWCL